MTWCSTDHVRGTTGLTGEAIGEVLNRTSDVVN